MNGSKNGELSQPPLRFLASDLVLEIQFVVEALHAIYMHVCISKVVLDFFVVDFYGCCAANAI